VYGTLLSLAEKVDNLLGCFAVGLKPTSSSDPYALRRQVLGIIRILIRGGYRVPLETLFSHCYDHFPKQYHAKKQEVLAEVMAFVTSRVKTVFLEYDVRKDEIEASLAQAVNDIFDTFCRVKALHDFRQSNQQFPQLYEVFKRAKGQLDGQHINAFDEKLLVESAEINLDKALKQIESPFHKAVNAQQYTEAYNMISHLQGPLAILFDEVKILADQPDLRQNRIALLQRVLSLFQQLLDFSKIQEG
jgi:glycyl-tRNA synthetase